MSDPVKDKGEVYTGTYLPRTFIDQFDKYVKSKNVSSVRNITKRELIYEALKEKMEKDKFKI